MTPAMSHGQRILLTFWRAHLSKAVVINNVLCEQLDRRKADGECRCLRCALRVRAEVTNAQTKYALANRRDFPN